MQYKPGDRIGYTLWEHGSVPGRGCRIFALNSLKTLPHMLPRGKNGLQPKL